MSLEADAQPRPRWPALRSGTVATTGAVTAVVVVTAVLTAINESLDAGIAIARDPAWLGASVAAAALASAVAALAVRPRQAQASAGLAIAAIGAVLPSWAGWHWLPGSVRSGVLAAAPLMVAGIALVGLSWHAAKRWRTAVLALAGPASVLHLLGYNGFADPSCVRTCAESAPLLEGVVTTQTTVAVVAALTIATASIGMIGLFGWTGPHPPAAVACAVLVALAATASASAYRWAAWSQVAPSRALDIVGPAALAMVAGAIGLVEVRALRIRTALRRLIDGLSEPAQVGGAIRAVQFAVPGEGRWIDSNGHDVAIAAASVQTLVLADDEGPMLRLLLGSRTDEAAIVARMSAANRLALTNARLAAVAKLRLAEVQASQQRIVAATDAERRRIERDLHDGAQQRLVSVAIHLRLAMADADPATAARLDAAGARVRGALAHLRHLAHGTFPSVLLDEGLGAALDELVSGCDVPTTVDLRIDDPIQSMCATAVYATVAASLAGVVAPSPSTFARVRIAQVSGSLKVEIEIAGAGITPDGDLIDAADRVGAAGGQLSFRQVPGHPVLISAVIPCAS